MSTKKKRNNDSRAAKCGRWRTTGGQLEGD